MPSPKALATACLALTALASCGINTVTKEELQAVKPGNILFFRYSKPTSTHSWLYAEKVVRVTADSVYLHPGTTEATSVNEPELQEFDENALHRISKADLVQFADAQGEEKRLVIRMK